MAQSVTAGNGNHVVCMCDDCQTFAHFLDRADIILDSSGGTTIYQTTPARLVLDGKERLRCVRLSPKGLMRWYAGCCNTPVANTMAGPRLPFAGLLSPLFSRAEAESVVGPVIAKCFSKFATGAPPPGSYKKTPARLILRMMRQFAIGFVRKQNRPNPFFASDGLPIVEPTILSKDERNALRSRARRGSEPTG